MKALLFIFTTTVAMTVLFHASVAAADAEETITLLARQLATEDDLSTRHLHRRGQEIKALNAAQNRFYDAAQTQSLPRRPPGMVIVPSTYDFITTYNLLKFALVADESCTLLEVVDHAALAGAQGATLLPNSVIFFTTSTRNQIMDKNIVASLDYPHRMLIWQEDEHEQCFVGYNSQEFLAARYSNDTTIDNNASIDQILSSLASAATGMDQNAFLLPSQAEVRRYRRSTQILIKDSHTNFISTWNRLTTFLEKDQALKPDGGFFVVDNSRNTLSAAVAVFGYAMPDTLLLQNNPTVGLDLPLRISVTEDANGIVQVAANSQSFLNRRYELVEAPTEINESLEDVVLFLVNHAVGANLPFRSAGMVLATSTRETFDETYANLLIALAAVGTIIAEVDNSPVDGGFFNKVLFVSFPELDDVILETHPRAALDLPHAVSVWQEHDEDGDSSVYVAFNAPRYLGSRFVPSGIPDAWDAAVLEVLGTAVSTATDSNRLSFLLPDIREFLRIRESPGHLIRQISDGNFDAAVDRLLNAITLFGLVKVYDVEGGEQAILVGESATNNAIRSRVIGFRFGPALEDRLLGDSISIGIDLPFKILVVRTLDGDVNVLTNDIAFLKERHDLSAAVKQSLDSFGEVLDTILDMTVNPVV